MMRGKYEWPEGCEPFDYRHRGGMHVTTKCTCPEDCKRVAVPPSELPEGMRTHPDCPYGTTGLRECLCGWYVERSLQGEAKEVIEGGGCSCTVISVEQWRRAGSMPGGYSRGETVWPTRDLYIESRPAEPCVHTGLKQSGIVSGPSPEGIEGLCVSFDPRHELEGRNTMIVTPDMISREAAADSGSLIADLHQGVRRAV